VNEHYSPFAMINKEYWLKLSYHTDIVEINLFIQFIPGIGWPEFEEYYPMQSRQERRLEFHGTPLNTVLVRLPGFGMPPAIEFGECKT
jgi:hypothetical protein